MSVFIHAEKAKTSDNLQLYAGISGPTNTFIFERIPSYHQDFSIIYLLRQRVMSLINTKRCPQQDKITRDRQ